MSDFFAKFPVELESYEVHSADSRKTARFDFSSWEKKILQLEKSNRLTLQSSDNSSDLYAYFLENNGFEMYFCDNHFIDNKQITSIVPDGDSRNPGQLIAVSGV